MCKIKIYLISLCMIMIAACDDSVSSSGCTKNSECSGDTPVCNTKTGKCEAEMPAENKCQSDDDCKDNG